MIGLSTFSDSVASLELLVSLFEGNGGTEGHSGATKVSSGISSWCSTFPSSPKIVEEKSIKFAMRGAGDIGLLRDDFKDSLEVEEFSRSTGASGGVGGDTGVATITGVAASIGVTEATELADVAELAPLLSLTRTCRGLDLVNCSNSFRISLSRFIVYNTCKVCALPSNGTSYSITKVVGPSFSIETRMNCPKLPV